MPKYGCSLTIGLCATSLYVRFGLGCGARIAIPASEGPPSFSLKNLICVALGLPSEIDQATIVPARGALRMLRSEPTLTWKPVVRLTARHGFPGPPGQLGAVTGVVAPITPTSVSVAGATAGRISASAATPASTAVDVRLICAIEHARPVYVAV